MTAFLFKTPSPVIGQFFEFFIFWYFLVFFCKLIEFYFSVNFAHLTPSECSLWPLTVANRFSSV